MKRTILAMLSAVGIAACPVPGAAQDIFGMMNQIRQQVERIQRAVDEERRRYVRQITSDAAVAPYVRHFVLRASTLRASPDSGARVVARVPARALVRLRSCAADGGWCQVIYQEPRSGSRTGYVPRADVESPAAALQRTRAMVGSRRVTLYRHPNFEGQRWAATGWEVPSLLGRLDSEASSLVIEGNYWVTFYNKPEFRGTRLHVRGPLALSNLASVERIRENWPNGVHWTDEIQSYRILTSRPGGAREPSVTRADATPLKAASSSGSRTLPWTLAASSSKRSIG
jgi:hypothetical protein